MATTREINMRDAIGKGKFAITGETIEHEGESLVALDIAWTLEVFIKHRANQIL